MKTFIDLPLSVLGCPMNINSLMRKCKLEKNYWSKSQITVSILITLSSTASIFNTLIAYQEKWIRTGNTPKEVAALKDCARGRFNLHSCCLHVGFFFFLIFCFYSIKMNLCQVFNNLLWISVNGSIFCQGFCVRLFLLNYRIASCFEINWPLQ